MRKMVEKLSSYEKGKLENQNLYQDYLRFIRNYNNILLYSLQHKEKRLFRKLKRCIDNAIDFNSIKITRLFTMSRRGV